MVPGWPTTTLWKPTLERAGNVLLPQAFTAIIAADDESDVVFLCMIVEGREVKMSAVMSTYSDVPTGLDRVRRAAPIGDWKRLAVAGMARWLAVADPDDLHRNFNQNFPSDKYAWWADAVRAWQAQLASGAEENATRAVETPVQRKRHRITREQLEVVAKIYRQADAMGAPPTRAVQEAYQTTHSTAAKWVARARVEGVLGPSAGSRGGELVSPAVDTETQPGAGDDPFLTAGVNEIVANLLKEGEKDQSEE